MAFSPQLLDELRQRLSLAQVIGRRVRLTKRGRDFIGLCPFHKEKTPSFNVVEDKAFYHCFGCGAHGDVIGFTMRVENMGFREAVEALAQQAGVALPKETPAERARAERVATLYDVCAAAATLYEEQLWAPAGKGGLAYLRDRGLSDELIRRFRLGWAPDSRSFAKAALAGAFPEPLLVEAGLLREGEGGERFDFFRGRVIFPICDRSGRVIAFGGRTLGDGQPKYLNSPETPIFQKGRALYAFHLARKEAATGAPIVTEGYMDVIALHGAGFTTAVAPLGTALTEEQIGDLWRLAAEPVICFDGDAAGQRAAVRTLDRALPQLQAGKSLRFVSLPEKHDPDSLLREAGAGAWQGLLDGAATLSDFLWSSATRGRVFPTVESIAELDAQLRRRVRAVPDRTLQFHLSRFVGDQIWQLSAEFRKRRRRPIAGEPAESGRRLDAFLSEESHSWKAAAALLGAVVNHPAIAAEDIDRFVMIRAEDPALMRLAHAIVAVIEEKPEIDAFELEDRLAALGFGELLERIRGADFFLACKFFHPGADSYDAALGWRAIFSRSRLAEAKADLEASIAEYERAPIEENWERAERLRRLVADQHSEAEFLPQQRDPIERWRPSRAA